MKKVKSRIIDTNVILRWLVGDNPEQFKQAAEWFNQAKKGKLNLYIRPIVVAECCFVLESVYKVDRKEIAEKMQVFLGQRWLKIKEKKALQNLWPYYLSGLHFVDSYLLSLAAVSNHQVLSFDKKLLS